MTRILLHASNAEGRLISANSIWLDTLGYTRKEAIGLHRRDYCTEQAWRLLRDFFLPTAIAQGELHDVPFEFRSRSGQVIPVISSAMMLYDPVGEVATALVSSEPADHDLHAEMLKLRKQLETVREHLREGTRSASDLLAALDS